MRQMNLALVSVSVVAALILGCGKKEEETTKTPTVDLVGTWVGDCVVDGTESEKNTLVATATELTFTSVAYSDTTCTTKMMTVGQTGTYATPTAADAPAGAFKMDFTLTAATMTTHGGAAANFNAGSVCGVTNWVDDTSQNINGKTCNDKAIPAAAAVIYDIVKVEDSKIYFGDESTTNDGTTEAKRHSEFETKGMTKQ